MTHPTREYQIVLIWLKDAAKFARYGALLAPIAHRLGADLERRIVPTTIHGAGITKPDMVNVVYYDALGGAAALAADPEFAKIVHLRSESIDMMALSGRATRGTGAEGEASSRTYVLELARFGSGNANAYERYQAESEPIFRRYGYEVERTLDVTSTAGLPFTPDLAKVAYFEGGGLDDAHHDPAHHRIENELYPAAVAESVWIVGRAG